MARQVDSRLSLRHITTPSSKWPTTQLSISFAPRLCRVDRWWTLTTAHEWITLAQVFFFSFACLGIAQWCRPIFMWFSSKIWKLCKNRCRTWWVESPRLNFSAIRCDNALKPKALSINFHHLARGFGRVKTKLVPSYSVETISQFSILGSKMSNGWTRSFKNISVQMQVLRA